jgi:hypothetical protein
VAAFVAAAAVASIAVAAVDVVALTVAPSARLGSRTHLALIPHRPTRRSNLMTIETMSDKMQCDYDELLCTRTFVNDFYVCSC